MAHSPEALMGVLLAAYREPLRHQERLKGPLPQPFQQVLQLAAGKGSPQIEALCSRWQSSPEEMRKAAIFYVEQACLDGEHDPYRILGLKPDADFRQIRAHYHLLMLLFHPDRTEASLSWRDGYAVRVNEAYRRLRKSGGRQAYGQEAKARKAGKKNLTRIYSSQDAPKQNVLLYLVQRFPRSIRYLPHFILGSGIVITALLVLNLYLARATEETVRTPSLPAKPIPSQGLSSPMEVALKPEESLFELSREATPSLLEEVKAHSPGQTDKQEKAAGLEAAPAPAEKKPFPQSPPAQKLAASSSPAAAAKAEANIQETPSRPAPSQQKSEPEPLAVPKDSDRESVKTAASVAEEKSKVREAAPVRLEEAKASSPGQRDNKEKAAGLEAAPVPAEKKPPPQPSPGQKLAASSSPVAASKAEANIQQAPSQSAPSQEKSERGPLAVAKNSGREREEKAASSVPHQKHEAVAPARQHATGSGPIPQSALQDLLRRFVATYQRGDLKSFLTLFSADASTNDYAGKPALRQDYARFFASTQVRELQLSDLRWQIEGDTAQGKGRYRVQISKAGGTFESRGQIHFQVQNQKGAPLITGLFNTAD